jgi:hypothetical protein
MDIISGLMDPSIYIYIYIYCEKLNCRKIYISRPLKIFTILNDLIIPVTLELRVV